MKKLIYFVIASLLIGCTVDTTVDELNQPSKTPTVFTVAFDETTTKTYVGNNGNLYWTKGDMLSIFTTTLNEKYAFDGNTGDNSATFGKINTGFGYGNPISKNYGVYPYSSSTRINDNGTLSVILPNKQAYAENSFGVNANTMVGVTQNSNDCFLPLKSVGGFLKLKLYGEGITVKKIRLEGNNSEKIAGASTITADYGTVPTVEMSADATTMITLNCGDGVALGDANNAKEFWIVVPPTLFESGFTVTVVDSNNMAFKQVSTDKQEIVRNTPLTMPAVKVVPTEPDTYEEEDVVVEDQPNNEIWYTSSDGRHIVPDCNPDYFGANVVDFIYENGKGIIRFDSDVTRIGVNDSSDGYGSYPFCGKETLTSISLPASVVSIGTLALAYCDNLKKVVLPEGLTSIYESSLCGNANLTEINLPSTLLYIGTYALSGTAMESVTLPEGVTQINRSLFAECRNLKNITLHDKLISIGDSAFEGTAISAIDIPDSVISIGAGAFAYCDNLKELALSSRLQYISESAFSGCYGLTEVVVPNGITTIDSGAFQECINLKSITFPDSVTSFGDGVLYDCAALESVVMPKGIAEIPSNMFRRTGIKSFTIPESVTTIGAGAFAETAIEEIVIPDNVTKINEAIFRSSEGGYYDYIGAFYSCDNLKKVTLGNGLTAIGQDMFADCNSLSEIVLGSKITTIGSGAFAGTAIKEFSIPDSVTKIETSVKSGWDGESNYTRSPFYNCYNLKKVTLGTGLLEICDRMFENCTSLSTVEFGLNIKSIGSRAFYSCCALNNFTIPSSITSIGNKAFYDCENLSTIVCEPTTPPTIGSDTFHHGPRIYVPQESYDSYISASGWSSYSDYIVGWDMSKGTPKLFTLTVSGITTNSAKVHIVPSDPNCTYCTYYVSRSEVENEHDGSIETYVNSLYNIIKSNVEANYYTWSDVLYTGEKNLAFHSNELVPGTEYYVFAFGVDATSGELTSPKTSYCSFYTNYSSVSYYDWVDSWNVTSPQTLEQSTVNEQYTEVIIDSTYTRTIRIEYAHRKNEHTYMNIYGWDSLGDDNTPALAEWKGNSLEMVDGYSAGDYNENFSAYWLPFSSIQGREGHYRIGITTPPYTFTMDDSRNTLTIKGLSGKLSSGETYEVKYFQITPVDKSTGYWGYWLYSTPKLSLYGNTMTAVRTESSTDSNQILSRSIPNTQLPAVSSQPTTNRISLPVKERSNRLIPIIRK